MVGDTELAFAAYESTPESTSAGSAYILVYGFLQALFLQQDAVRNLCQALKLEYSPDPLLKLIRDVRNDAVGHPTKRRDGKRTSFSFISRLSISKLGFQLMTLRQGAGPPVFRSVDLNSLLDKQRNQLRSTLSAVVDSLRREEMEHRERFRSEKLADVFPATLDYYFEKLYESTHGGKGWEFGKLHVDLLARILTEFKEALQKRGTLGAYDEIEHHLGLAAYPLEQLVEYFVSGGRGKLNDRDAFIFISFLEDELRTLREMAAEIDEEYARDVK